MQFEAQMKQYPETYSYTLMGAATECNEEMRQIQNFYPKVKV